MKRSYLQSRACVAEFIGSFVLVFAGTGAIILDDVTHGIIGVTGIGLTFGLAVTAMIYVFGPVSGAHINPAVTFTLWLARLLSPKRLIPYIAFQCAGAIMASIFLRLIFSSHPTLGATIPHGSSGQSFILEFFLTFILIFSIFAVSKNVCSTKIAPALMIGIVVGCEATFAGPISGASMNPARSLGPAIVSGHLEYLWIYVVAPMLGGVSAMLAWSGLSKCSQYLGFSFRKPSSIGVEK